jgi:dipeptidase
MRTAAVLLPLLVGAACGCSNLLISPGASTDGSGMISYASDDGGLYGDLAHYPAADHAPGSMRDTYDWDSGAYLGQIPEAAHTYGVVGNMNEWGLAISETTFGGLPAYAAQPGALLSYGGLIWVTLQRAKTAREAVRVMGELVATYGYASEGESFSLNDGEEVWYMEMFSKGKAGKGAVWVALRVPDGHVTAHANQARIRSWDWSDAEGALYAEDVCTFAQGQKLYPAAADCKDFSFSDTYDPVDFSGARFCEARVWSFFGAIMGPSFADEYEDYITGRNLTHRMPVFVKPARKLSLNDTMWHFRNHYEGTVLDQRADVGAGPFRSAFRVGDGLQWEASSGRQYVNERAISVQATGWHFTAQVRNASVPPPVRGILWFGPDDTKHTLNVPFYSGTTRVPAAWDGADCMGRSACRRAKNLTGTITDFSFQAAHWVFNMVSNYAYSRYDAITPVVSAKIAATEARWFAETAVIDAKATALYAADPAAAVKMVTDYSFGTGAKAVTDWLAFWQQLFVTFVDGYETKADATNQVCGCSKNSVPYPQSWHDRIANETGSKYEVPDGEVGALGASRKRRFLSQSRRAPPCPACGKL